ncbi:MAG TPA: dTDP-4-dehydrorhamnose 3,5-epimerase family protein [Gammaproteobacteria bacterium]
MMFDDLRVTGCYRIRTEPQIDERGWFARTYCSKEYGNHDIDFRIVQSSVSHNIAKGTLRGMHYQRSPSRECKLVRCGRGAVYDVIIDLRRDSRTYLIWDAVELTEENGQMVYIPAGCAHGYLTLKDDTQVVYQMNEAYSSTLSEGVRWNDPAFAIHWPEVETLIISDRDRSFPDYRE